jgi:photosystem II stability/assembly factor-like uncharacterized protein
VFVEDRPAEGLMMTHPLQTRRVWLRRTAGLAAAGAWPLVTGAAASQERRFAALTRPALSLRQPGQAALLDGTHAGKRIVAVGERGVVALSDDEGGRWRQARSVPTSVSLTAVRFVDERCGWAVGHGGVILATRDGGESWLPQTDGRALAVIAQQAARALAASGEPGADALQKNADLLVADGPDKPLLDLHVVDAQRVMVVGAYGLAYETRDGGRTWASVMDRIANPKGQHLYALRARGDTWLLAGEQGLLLRSHDAGRSFQRIATPYAGSWFTIAVTPRGRWLVAGLRGNAFVSDDDGERWTRLDGGPPASFVGSVALPDGGVLLANQAGQIFAAPPSGALVAVPGPSLPPLSQLVPLSGGALLALGLAGALRLPRRPA